MKKIMSFILIVALIGCMCGCKSNNDEKPPETTEHSPALLDMNESTATETTLETTEPVSNEATIPTETTSISNEPEYFTNEHGTYRRVNERVRTEGNVFLRSYPNGKKVVSVNVDVTLTRVGIGEENGWSIVLYNDEEVYVPTYYLFSLENPHYEKVEEVVYTTQEVNFRSGPSIRSLNLGKFLKNSALTRIGIGEDGWSKILHNDQPVYVYSLYLETRDATPEIDPVETQEVSDSKNTEAVGETEPVETEPRGEIPINELTEYQEDGVIYKVVDEMVEAARTVNVRSGPSAKFEKLGQVAGAKTIQRIAIGDNGWSKVIFKGQEAYIKSEYLLKR